MAKKRIQNYVFLPGVASSSNAYPNAYSLINSNLNFITNEATAWIANQVTTNSALSVYPNAVALLKNNQTFIVQEISAWITAQIAGAGVGTTFYGYSYTSTIIAKCLRDTGYLVTALIQDVQWGGNENVSYVASQYYLSGVLQIVNTPVELAIQTQLWNIISNYILKKVAYTSQQNPVTSTQNLTGTVAETAAQTQVTGLSTYISNVITGGLSTLPSIVYPTYPFTNYIYDSAKCQRDIGFVLGAYLNDLRYGGNYQISLIASRYWSKGYPQITGDRRAEILTHQFIATLINNYIITQSAYPSPYQTAYPIQQNANIVGEVAAETVITTLSGILTSVITNGTTALPTLVNGVTTVKVQGKYKLDTILLITNTTNNTILYNFADNSHSARVSYSGTYDSNGTFPDLDFPQFIQTADYVTTIAFDINTSTYSSTDDVQIFVEDPVTRTRPYDFGTDAIERQRTANPQSMIDADFEYGLQPTKWQALGIARGYPSIYELPGTDIAVSTVQTDASTGTSGVGASLITVTTVSAHGLTVGQPFTISAFANSVAGFARAEGSFIVFATPTITTFTYYATSKVGANNGDVLSSTYTQLRKGQFYTGASIGSPTFSVYSNGTTGTITSKFITSTGTQQIAYTGTLPPAGVPITGTGIPSGVQVSGTIGSGGLVTTATVLTDTNIGDNNFTVVDPTGIIEGLGIDNGSGTAVFVNAVIGSTIYVNNPLTTARIGSVATFTNVGGTNIVGVGSGAVFTVTRTSGAYGSVTPTTAGTGYVVGKQIIILGTSLGGTSPANDITVVVATIDGSGGVATLTYSGTSISGELSFTNVGQSSTTGSGINAKFSISTSATTYNVLESAIGSGYVLNEVLTILGTSLGGTTPGNDLSITVTSINGAGAITSFSSSGVAISPNATFTNITSTSSVGTGTGATFDITRTSGVYSAVQNQTGTNYQIGDRIKVLGTVLDGATTANDVTITITAVTGTAVGGFTISGTATSGSSVAFYSSVSLSDFTTANIPDSTTLTTAAISKIQIAFASNHGLVPGTSMLINISSTGTNHTFAKGPFFVEQVPTPTTIIYTARTAGAIDTGTTLIGSVYARPNSFFTHRPFDGGVQLGTGGPQHSAQAIRMSKKYIRYQSGKGIMFTTGALFAPSFDIQSLTATGTAVGSFISLTTDDTDHGCQTGGYIKIVGVDTPGYNGTYIVDSITSERVLVVRAITVLSNVYATITTSAQMTVLRWSGATVRSGTFDDQNGLFWQYDGQYLSVVKRSSTFKLAGTVNISPDSNLVTGLNTRFRDQTKAGDRITIKGMTHVVTNVQSQTSMTVAPDYRGNTACVSGKACLIVDTIVQQSQFNMDRMDGTGPSGYNVDIGKMQMIGLQWSWYGAGFIDFMMRGSDGNFIFAHRIRNSNVNTEAYMRTGNMPVRYEVINESAIGKLASSITASQTTIPLLDATYFPTGAGQVYIDNELISFSGKSGNTLIGCNRASAMLNFVGGDNRTFTAGPATTHEVSTGVILVSNTISPNISHWGSAFVTDGGFDFDRGYLFSYASTGIAVSTTVATAFLMRLAPSVSDAIVGDLGDRELLNRAQLLLKQIRVTSDSGTGGIVIQGIINPSNYPTDPGSVTWASLSSQAAGGQPSFTQVAPGGSVNWAGGGSTTTSTATVISAPTGNVTMPSSALFNQTIGSYTVYVSKTSWDTLGAQAGYSLSSAEAKFPSGTTISTVVANPSSIATTLTQITGSATIPTSAYFKTAVGATTIAMLQTSWTTLGGSVGVGVYSSDFPANTTVTGVTGPFSSAGYSYYNVAFSAGASTAHNPVVTTLTITSIVYSNPTVTFGFTAQTYTPYSNGDSITVSGLTGTAAGYNGTYTVVSCSTTTVQVNQATNYGTTVAGTPRVVNNNSLSTITFAVGGTAASTTSTLIFTQASWNSLPIGTAVVGNTVNDPFKLSAGTVISTISNIQTFNNVSYYTVTFSNPLLINVPGGTAVTFTYIPYYTLTMSKPSSVAVTYATASSCSFSGTTLTLGGTVVGTFSIGMTLTGSGVSTGAVITAGSGTTWTVSPSQSTLSGVAITATPYLSVTPAIVSSTSSFQYFSQTTWETLVASYGATVGTLVVTPTYFPANTTISSVSSLSSFGGTNYYRLNFTQSALSTIPNSTAITFSFGLPAYAQPGETVFQYIAAPGTEAVLDLNELKELTNTTLGGRGCFPNGPDVLCINLYRPSGSGTINANVLIRWGEAQA